MSSQARSKWNCLVPCSFGHAGGWWSYGKVLMMIEDMLGDRAITRVSQVEERHGIGRRQLEWLLARYVGVGPKWVLGRYRMHDVIVALDGGYDGSLTDRAAGFGWFDQAHFNRDFIDQVGVSPGTYRARAGCRQPS